VDGAEELLSFVKKASGAEATVLMGYVATHVEDLSEEEVAKRAQDLAAQS
jgi:hypothetical protein